MKQKIISWILGDRWEITGDVYTYGEWKELCPFYTRARTVKGAYTSASAYLCQTTPPEEHLQTIRLCNTRTDELYTHVGAWWEYTPSGLHFEDDTEIYIYRVGGQHS